MLAPDLFYPDLVGLSGLEPPTSRLSGVRSNRLSYKPSALLFLQAMEMERFELVTSCLQGRRSPNWANPPYSIIIIIIIII